MDRIPGDLTQGLATNEQRCVIVLAWLLSDQRADDAPALLLARRLVQGATPELPRLPPLRTLASVLLALEQRCLIEKARPVGDGWFTAEVRLP